MYSIDDIPLYHTKLRIVRTALQFLLLSAFVLSADSAEPVKTPEALVADFAAGRFLPGPINRTGWTMETSTGGSFHRADLNRQAQELARRDQGISAGFRPAQPSRDVYALHRRPDFAEHHQPQSRVVLLRHTWQAIQRQSHLGG